MAVARNASGWLWPRRALGPVAIAGLFYLYILYVLRPELLLHSQSPAFFAHWPTFIEHVRLWPGGLVEYLAAGLMVTFAYAPLGALVLTAGVAATYLFTRMLLAAACPSLPCGAGLKTIAAVPPVLLLMLLNRYTLPLGVIIALCVALAAAHVYVRLTTRQPLVRLALALLLCAAVHLGAGAVSVLLACICATLELTRRQRVLVAVILVLGAAMPYVAGAHLYGISQADAYLRLTAIAYDFSPPIASIALYALFPLGLTWTTFAPRLRRVQPAASPAVSLRRNALFTLLTLAVAAGAAHFSLDRDRRAVLAVDYHARQGQWAQALEAAQRLQWSAAVPGKRDDEQLARTCVGFHFPVSPAQPALLLPTYNVAIHDINLALAHTGRLLDDMFRYPQRMGVSVVRLLPDDMGAYVTHSYNPDILLQLGHVNEAERVTCECLANVGPRPWLLERLVAVSVLKGHAQAARTCLAVMARDPGCRNRAEALRSELDKDATLARWDPVRIARTRMYRTDRTGHIAGMDPDEEMLRYLLATNPRNRLAFDYLMAHYLLTLRTDQIAAGVRHLREFGYTALPRHFEEALLLRASMDGKMPDLGGFTIRPDTQRRFDGFQRAIGNLGGPGDGRVRDALVPAYGDTYWFYALFGATFWRDVPATRPAEGP